MVGRFCEVVLQVVESNQGCCIYVQISYIEGV